jgi:hypothetical protein
MTISQIFPTGLDPVPLALAAGEASPFVPFAETLGPSPDGSPGDGMVVAVACSGGAAATPRIRVRASGGEPVAVELEPQAVEVHSADGTPLGQVVLRAPHDGVHRVDLFVSRPGNDWAIEITNADAAARTFTWVASDTIAGAAKPWIDVTPRRLELVAKAGGEPDARTVTVENHGTGPLRLSGHSEDAIPGLTITIPDAPIAPGATGAVELAFAPPAEAAAGSVTTRCGLESNDLVAEHRRSVELTVTTEPRGAEVAVIAVRPPDGDAFRDLVAGQRWTAALSLALASVGPVGELVYAEEAELPLGGEADQDAVTEALRRKLGTDDPFHTRVTYLRAAEDDATSVVLLDQRRMALGTATTSRDTDTGRLGGTFGLSIPSEGVFAVPPEAFAVARANGVTQPAIMVVEVVFCPVIESVTVDGGGSGEIHGRNLVLQPGDPVDIFGNTLASPTEEFDHCSTIVHPLPDRLLFVVPTVTLPTDALFFISRDDGLQTPTGTQVHLFNDPNI